MTAPPLLDYAKPKPSILHYIKRTILILLVAALLYPTYQAAKWIHTRWVFLNAQSAALAHTAPLDRIVFCTNLDIAATHGNTTGLQPIADPRLWDGPRSAGILINPTTARFFKHANIGVAPHSAFIGNVRTPAGHDRLLHVMITDDGHLYCSVWEPATWQSPGRPIYGRNYTLGLYPRDVELVIFAGQRSPVDPARINFRILADAQVVELSARLTASDDIDWQTTFGVIDHRLLDRPVWLLDRPRMKTAASLERELSITKFFGPKAPSAFAVDWSKPHNLFVIGTKRTSALVAADTLELKRQLSFDLPPDEFYPLPPSLRFSPEGTWLVAGPQQGIAIRVHDALHQSAPTPLLFNGDFLTFLDDHRIVTQSNGAMLIIDLRKLRPGFNADADAIHTFKNIFGTPAPVPGTNQFLIYKVNKTVESKRSPGVFQRQLSISLVSPRPGLEPIVHWRKSDLAGVYQDSVSRAILVSRDGQYFLDLAGGLRRTSDGSRIRMINSDQPYSPYFVTFSPNSASLISLSHEPRRLNFHELPGGDTQAQIVDAAIEYNTTFAFGPNHTLMIPIPLRQEIRFYKLPW